MNQLDFLQDFVVILAAAITVVTVLRRIHVPTIAGFIVAGVILGPHALGLVREQHQVEVLAEFGVVLLLFGIGLELSLDRLGELWRTTVLSGAVQVGATVLCVVAVGAMFGLNFRAALLVGFIVAVSSTAIALKGL